MGTKLLRPPGIRPFRGVQRPRWPYKLNRDSKQAEGLKAWWSFFEGAGLGAIDLAGENNTLSFNLLGASAWNTDQVLGTVIKGSGTNDEMMFRDDADLSLGFPGKNGAVYENFSFAFWMRFTGNAGFIFSKDNTGERSYSATIGTSAGQGLRFEAHNPTPASSGFWTTNLLTADTVYHIVYTYKFVTDGTSEMRIYRDGVEDGNLLTAVGRVAGEPRRFEIFERTGFAGSSVGDFGIADFRVYDRTLTPVEIKEMYSPSHRWDLYQEALRVFYSFPAAEAEELTSGFVW